MKDMESKVWRSCFIICGEGRSWRHRNSNSPRPVALERFNIGFLVPCGQFALLISFISTACLDYCGAVTSTKVNNTEAVFLSGGWLLYLLLESFSIDLRKAATSRIGT